MMKKINQAASHSSGLESQCHPAPNDKRFDDSELDYLPTALDHYSTLLKNYQVDLFRWLNSASSFSQYKQRISDELRQFGLADWSFTKLGGDQRVGLLSGGDDFGLARVFCDCDLMLQHASVSDEPVYQSQIESHVKEAPYSTELMERYLLMLASIKQQGYIDIYCIPVVDELNETRSIFCATSKGMDVQEFEDRTLESQDMLKILARVVGDVGIRNHAKYMIDSKKKYKQLMESQPFKLLAAMIRCDKELDDKKLRLLSSSINKYLTKIRNKIFLKDMIKKRK
ncbi:MAG: hypothetical protein JKY66_10650 [Spongiibacteraceae bacterium]|nr:hypothetical protein [Spongiibacteraceae bacterium]